MPNVTQSIFMRSLRREAVERCPVWLMRQAGRYLPEYRKTRLKAGDFLSLCKNPTLACEVTLQPLRRYPLDAAILFSDILTIPDAMGLGLSFREGEGPCFARPIRTTAAIDALPQIQVDDDLEYVMAAARLIRQEMPDTLPLIGFSGSPWTLACYMIEGQSSREFKKTLCLMYEHPEAMHVLLTKLANTVEAYLEAQIRAGVDVLMLFDTWGGILTTRHYQLFSLNHMTDIICSLKRKHPHIPIILFTKGGGQWLNEMANSSCDAIGLDWTVDLMAARKQVGNRVALQGNLDPTVLLTSADCIRREVHRILSAYGEGSGLIFNLGHGITPDVPPDHVQVMVDAVHAYFSEGPVPTASVQS